MWSSSVAGKEDWEVCVRACVRACMCVCVCAMGVNGGGRWWRDLEAVKECWSRMADRFGVYHLPDRSQCLQRWRDSSLHSSPAVPWHPGAGCVGVCARVGTHAGSPCCCLERTRYHRHLPRHHPLFFYHFTHPTWLFATTIPLFLFLNCFLTFIYCFFPFR